MVVYLRRHSRNAKDHNLKDYNIHHNSPEDLLSTPTNTHTMKLPANYNSISSDTPSAHIKRPIVIGIYGLSGCGKTYLLNQLKRELDQKHFTFFDGSQVIAAVVPGGLEEFQTLDEQEKICWREVAIEIIKRDCLESGRTAVVAGHFMFWPEEEESGHAIYTQNDLDTYTHIIYLDTVAEIIAQRRMNDTKRQRPVTTVNHLHKWQLDEKNQLARLCRDHNILFSPVSRDMTLLASVIALLIDFRYHTEDVNLRNAEIALDEVVMDESGRLSTLLVLDADKTLAEQDTGTMFWERLRQLQQTSQGTCPLKELFSSQLGYTYTAFRQAMLLYEEATTDQVYNALCQDIAAAVTMHPEFVSLLQFVAGQDHIRAVVVSCGLRRVWEAVLERAGVSNNVKVIAGGRISDGYVVTGDVKAALVTRSREVHSLYVWAFGDSVLDLGMLRNANRAVVVTGTEPTRSKTMDAALAEAILIDGLSAHQTLLPRHAPSRLSIDDLPLLQLTDTNFVAALKGDHLCQAETQIVHATDRNAAKLLMTPMRDANISGPGLREAHSSVGRYLATEFVTEVLGVEEYSIPHVQGNTTSGFRLLHEQQTLIVALMRGGEPMAFGVNDAFPLAMFLHASCPEDIAPDVVSGKLTVILVDSVVNSGKSVVEFVHHIRSLHATIRIVVVAGVVQAQCMSQGLLSLAGDTQLSMVALRLSENKFTGRGTTDTGNRLFNTTHLP